MLSLVSVSPRVPVGVLDQNLSGTGADTTSLRDETPVARQRTISASKSEQMKWIRFQHSGAKLGTVGHRLAG
jgi:hypothetical protein